MRVARAPVKLMCSRMMSSRFSCSVSSHFFGREKTLKIENLSIPLPRPAGLIIEKLLTDRSGEKGDRDLLVALALLLVSEAQDLTEIEATYQGLSPELRYTVRSGLSTLSLLEPRLSMPDPTLHRILVADLLARLEKMGSNQ